MPCVHGFLFPTWVLSYLLTLLSPRGIWGLQLLVDWNSWRDGWSLPRRKDFFWVRARGSRVRLSSFPFLSVSLYPLTRRGSATVAESTVSAPASSKWVWCFVGINLGCQLRVWSHSLRGDTSLPRPSMFPIRRTVVNYSRHAASAPERRRVICNRATPTFRFSHYDRCILITSRVALLTRTDGSSHYLWQGAEMMDFSLRRSAQITDFPINFVAMVFINDSTYR